MVKCMRAGWGGGYRGAVVTDELVALGGGDRMGRVEMKSEFLLACSVA